MLLLLGTLLSAHATDATKPLEAIWQTEQARQPPEAFLPWVASDTPEIRARTATALGRLRDESALPSLRALLEDPAALVRREAAFALGLTPNGVRILMEDRPDDPDAIVRARIFDALGLHGHSEAMPWLLEGLADEEPVARACAVAIGRIGMERKEAVDHPHILQELVYALEWDQTERRRAAAFALARIGPTAWRDDTANKVQELAKNDYDPLVRSRLVRALTADQVGQAVVPILQDAAADREPEVRIAAARALEKLPPDRAVHIGLLLLNDRSLSVRISAAEALVDIEDTRLHRPLIDLKSTPHPALQRVAGARFAAVHGYDHQTGWSENFEAGWVSRVNYPQEADESHLRPFVFFATRSESELVRTTAASRLLEANAAPKWAVQLLSAKDKVIQSIGISMLGDRPQRQHLEKIAPLLSPTGSYDVWIATLDLLNQALDNSPRMRLPSSLKTALQGGIATPGVSEKIAALWSRLGEPPMPPFAAPEDLSNTMPSLQEIRRHQVARIFTSEGEVRVRLRPDIAPATVWNFVRLAESNYFDNLAFHRVVPDFVIQDGCPRGDGWGSPTWTIPDELSALPFKKGTLGMALSGPDTGGSQWFITLSDQPHLEGKYSVFGELIGDDRVAQRIQIGSVIQDILIEKVPEPMP